MPDRRLFRPTAVAAGHSGTLVEVTPAEAGWELIHFAVRAVAAGTSWTAHSVDEEICLVLLAGHCTVRWHDGPEQMLGPRADVFSGYPHAVYLPPEVSCTVTALAPSELADCRALSTRALTPRLIRPEDCGFEIRGGGNATRQIVDIVSPSFPADRLMICEVFTPGGNWSSYPPHKHDRHNPPLEADLEETYYFRMRRPEDGFGFQRLYAADGTYDETFTVQHGDVLLIHDGYHPFVTSVGNDAYYLNVLAGSDRSMAATDDPRYAAIRASWPPPDARAPLVPRP
jgi:5-deoxy-glucuronate isomerase